VSPHQQGMNARRRGGLQPLGKIVVPVFIHQKSHRAEIHSVDRNIAAKVRMQRLQHKTVAAERDDHRGIIAGIIIARSQLLQSGLRFG